MGPQVIPLSSIAPTPGRDAMRAALSSGGGGCAAKSCDSSAGADTLPAAVWDKIKESSLLQRGGAPLFRHACTWRWPRHCNIQCHYCNRKYDCTNESRPGVVSERLTLDQARRKVIAVANEVPQLSVLGIAGPGDALYDFKKTFQLVAKTLPDIKLCLSTNGLALPDHVDTIADMNIDHVTITINMVDPEIGERIYPWIYYRHRRWTGREAARILHERQMARWKAWRC